MTGCKNLLVQLYFKGAEYNNPLCGKNTEKEYVIQTEDLIVRLNYSQILYVEKDKNYLMFHTDEGQYRTRGTMTALEEKLRGEGFSKCISGCLANLRHVTKMIKDTVWLKDMPLPISRQRKKEFKEDFMRYLGGDY